MIRHRRWLYVFAVSFLGLTSAAEAQTINGTSLAFRSSGTASGSDWTLSENGYVGTYVTLAAPGDLTVSAQASGLAGGGVDPNMNIVIADTKAGFDVMKATLEKDCIQILGVQTFATKDRDFNAQLTALKNLKPDILFVSALV